jgi:phage shock protein E
MNTDNLEIVTFLDYGISSFLLNLNIQRNQRRILFLLIAFTAIGVVYYTQFYGAERVYYGDISVSEAKTLMEEKPYLVILDVRTVSEYEEGHVEEAINIPVQELDDRIDEISKNDELLVYCRTGNRSGQAVNILESSGFTKIFHMYEGITGWKNAGYPLVQ